MTQPIVQAPAQQPLDAMFRLAVRSLLISA